METSVESFAPAHREFYGEADTRAKLIDPKLHDQGWTEEHIRREQTPGGIEIANGVARRLSRKHIDYVLRVKVSTTTQPVAVAYVEAKAENHPAEEGLQQVKDYATTASVCMCRLCSAPTAISSSNTTMSQARPPGQSR